MSHWKLLSTTLLLSCAILTAGAQSFSIDWFTIDGGGGTSSGGNFTLSGTIGQPDAGTMSGGNFSLNGGFWALFAVQTVGSPLLSINRTATNTILISWPASSPSDFVLQENAVGLNTLNWNNTTNSVQNDGVLKSIVINPPTGNRFYRLQKP